jgi:hypothetical protein
VLVALTRVSSGRILQPVKATPGEAFQRIQGTFHLRAGDTLHCACFHRGFLVAIPRRLNKTADKRSQRLRLLAFCVLVAVKKGFTKCWKLFETTRTKGVERTGQSTSLRACSLRQGLIKTVFAVLVACFIISREP